MSRLVRWYRRLSLRSRWGGYAFALACVLLAVGVRSLISLEEPGVEPFATFFPAIVLPLVFAGIGPGFVALALATGSGYVVALAPTYQWNNLDPSDRLALLMFVASGAIVLIVGATLRRAVESYDRALVTADQEHRRLALAMEASRLGLLAYDIAEERMEWSQAVGTSLGLSPERQSASRAEWLALVHPDERAEADRTLATIAAREQSYHIGARRFLLPNGETRVLEIRGTVLPDAKGAPMRLEGVALDITERRQAEEQQEQIIRELNHRVKNTLAAVQAIASQTARSATSFDSYQRSFRSRIDALAATNQLLIEAQWRRVPLAEIVLSEVAPYDDPARSRIALEGPALAAPPDLVTPIGLIVHELATNAAKYGALKDHGSVRVCWKLTGEALDRLTITWSEDGGPPVTAPSRAGFGSRLIDRVVRAQLKGDVSIDYDPTGVKVRLVLPLTDSEGSGEGWHAPDAATRVSPPRSVSTAETARKLA